MSPIDFLDRFARDIYYAAPEINDETNRTIDWEDIPECDREDCRVQAIAMIYGLFRVLDEAEAKQYIFNELNKALSQESAHGAYSWRDVKHRRVIGTVARDTGINALKDFLTDKLELPEEE